MITPDFVSQLACYEGRLKQQYWYWYLSYFDLWCSMKVLGIICLLWWIASFQAPSGVGMALRHSLFKHACWVYTDESWTLWLWIRIAGGCYNLSILILGWISLGICVQSSQSRDRGRDSFSVLDAEVICTLAFAPKTIWRISRAKMKYHAKGPKNEIGLIANTSHESKFCGSPR